MGWASHSVERELRKRGVGTPDDPMIVAYIAELRSTDGGRTVLPRELRLSVLAFRPRIGQPVGLGLTARTIALSVSAPIGMRSDIAAVAAAWIVDGPDIDLLLIDEPPRQYRLRLTTAAAAVDAVQQLTKLPQERLDALPNQQRAH